MSETPILFTKDNVHITHNETNSHGFVGIYDNNGKDDRDDKEIDIYYLYLFRDVNNNEYLYGTGKVRFEIDHFKARNCLELSQIILDNCDKYKVCVSKSYFDYIKTKLDDPMISEQYKQLQEKVSSNRIQLRQ